MSRKAKAETVQLFSPNGEHLGYFISFRPKTLDPYEVYKIVIDPGSLDYVGTFAKVVLCRTRRGAEVLSGAKYIHRLPGFLRLEPSGC